MKNYSITINGSGTAKEIAEALRSLAGSVECDLIESSADWEDPILSTQIHESELSRDEEAALEEARQILCDNDDLEGDSILAQIKLIAKHYETAPDDYIDYVDDVIVWGKVTNTYTCEEFLEEIGWSY